MNVVITDLHRSNIHCKVPQGSRNTPCSRNSSWDHTCRTVSACTCSQHLHTLPHCNCSQYPWNRKWQLTPWTLMPTATFCYNLEQKTFSYVNMIYRSLHEHPKTLVPDSVQFL